MNLEDLRARLVERWEGQVISHQDVLSAALYPKVFDEYKCVERMLCCVPHIACAVVVLMPIDGALSCTLSSATGRLW